MAIKKVKKNRNYKEVELNSILSYFKKFWYYIWYDDSFGSYIANFAFAYVFIKFILFPALGLLLGTSFPIVAIVSGSMEHKYSIDVDSQGKTKIYLDNQLRYTLCTDSYMKEMESLNFDENVNLNKFWDYCGDYYINNFNLTKNDFESFEYKNGLNIGDVLVLRGKDPSKIEVGEVLIFIPQDINFYLTKGPVIHRVVKKWEDENGKFHFQTKGDHNSKSFQNFENDIIEDNVLAVSVVRVPYIGYAKIALSNMIFFVTGRGGI